MAFNINCLTSVGGSSKPLSGLGTSALAGSPNIWAYATPDTVATVRVANYFAAAASMLRRGDWILLTAGAGSGGTLAPAIMFVNQNDGTTIDVTDGTTISVTDTD